jgi:hypothetical protein
MRPDGRLARSWRDGDTTGPGYLDDHAFMADALLDLYETTGEPRRLEEAEELADALLRLFEDHRGGGFFFTAEADEDLLARTKRPFDQTIPSGNGRAALVLVRLAEATGEAHYLRAAERTLETFSAAMRNAPTATETLLTATGRYLDTEGAAARSKDTSEEMAPDARARRGPVTVEAWASHRRARPGDTVRVAIRVQMEEGWHINAHEPLQEELVATELELDACDRRYVLAEAHYPEGELISPDFSDDELSVYTGEIWLQAIVQIRPDAEEGNEPVRLSLAAQPCDDRSCARPERHRLELPLQVDADAPERHRHKAIFERFEGR